MARREVIILVDDVDGTEASETIRFAFEGREFELDLSEQNAAAMREAMTPWVSAARRIGGRQVGAGGRERARRDSAQTAAIRAWAAENGHQVSTHGRIPAAVERAFHEAGGARVATT